MTRFTWSQTLETGHPTMDEQHKVLLTSFENLRAFETHPRQPQESARAILYLMHYAIQHFRFEEGLMDQSHYPLRMRHKMAHHDLVAKLTELMKLAAEGSLPLPTTTVPFLEAWLAEHILLEDFRLAAHLRSHS